MVLMPKWDAEQAMRLIEREKVTYFVGVPLMSYEIATHPNKDDYDLSSLERLSTGFAITVEVDLPRGNALTQVVDRIDEAAAERAHGNGKVDPRP